MKRRFAVLPLALVLAISGCIRTLAPLFEEKDLLFEPKLLGTWNVGADDDWTFSRHGEREYRLTIYQKNFSPTLFAHAVPGDTARFVAQLGRLGDELFLDVTPVTDSRGTLGVKNDFFAWHFVPTHSIFRVRFVHDSLRLTMLDSKWMESMIKEKKVEVRHYEETGDGILLTGSTEELQALVRHYAADDKAFLPLDRIGHEYH